MNKRQGVNHIRTVFHPYYFNYTAGLTAVGTVV